MIEWATTFEPEVTVGIADGEQVARIISPMGIGRHYMLIRRGDDAITSTHGSGDDAKSFALLLLRAMRERDRLAADD